MTNYVILWADGIGSAKVPEPDYAGSILYEVVRPLVANLTRRRHFATDKRVVWPASMAGIGGPLSWEDATREGVQWLNNTISETPEDIQVILLGYSGGCRVIHDWMDQNPDLLDRVAAVGLLSDPYRPLGRSQYGTRSLGGWGIAGQRRGPIPQRTFWTSVEGDVISDARPDALLRTVADLSDRIPGGFLDSLWGHHLDGSWQLAWQLNVIRTNPLGWLGTLGVRLDQARVDIHGYMTGRHTLAYLEPHETASGNESLAQRLADTVAYKANLEAR